METVHATRLGTFPARSFSMTPTRFFIGLDIGSEQFSAALGMRPWKLLASPQTFANTLDGFQTLQAWLAQHHCDPGNCLLCMEATGVYGEALTYWLVAQGYRVAVEPPLRVKRAFKPYGPKSDAVDSRQIAEYAVRYEDQLTFWQPRCELLEQVQVLLTTREQLVQQSTAHKNSLHALERKAVRTPVAETIHQQLIQTLQREIKALERELRRVFEQEPPAEHLLLLVLTIPGIGLLLASQFLVLTRCAAENCNPKRLAAHQGMAPLVHESGKSVWRPPRSRGFGSGPVRKLFHLAARSVCTHNPEIREYYERKLAEGKPKQVVLNNVANKLLKVMCAVVVSQTPYDPHYMSRRLSGTLPA
jgi:transposase